jgi:hypothetical protein
MQNNYEEYSEQIKYFDWPDAAWRLDSDDELQLRADIDETKEIIRFVRRLAMENKRPSIKRRKLTDGTKGTAA